MSNFKLSCIVPFKDYLVLRDNLFKSLVTFSKDVEIILVHDTTIELEEVEINTLKSLQAKVIYVSGDYRSAARARNQGLAQATGEWIIFWDSDDYGFGSETLSVIERAGANEVLICGFRINAEKLSNSREYVPGSINLRQLVAMPGMWRTIFRRDVVQGTLFPEIPLGEDILFLISCNAFDKHVSISEKIVYEYRLSNSQATRNMNLVNELRKFLKEFSKLLRIQQPRSILPYGIFIRQTLSLIRVSKGKALIECLEDIFELYGTLEMSARRSLWKGIALALTKKPLLK